MFMGLFEVAGIVSILPFLSVAINKEIVFENEYLNAIYNYLNFTNVDSFLFSLGVCVFIVLVANNVMSAFATWRILRFSSILNHTLSKKLLAKYVKQPYAFHLNRNSSELSKNILSEVGRAVVGVMLPVIHVISRIVVAMFIFGLLVVVEPLLALGVMFVLGGAYIGIYAIIKRKLATIGEASSEENSARYKIVNESISGIKDIKLLGCEETFIRQFTGPSKRFAGYYAAGQIYAQLPRYALEMIAFGGVIFITLYLIQSKENAEQALPLVALYAFAGYRLLPSLQQIFLHVSTVRFHLSALNIMHNDLEPEDVTCPSNDFNLTIDKRPALSFQNRIELNEISFSYPNSNNKIIDNLSITIKPNTTIGFIGETGSGKTTLVDILLGLLSPSSGSFLVDGISVISKDIALWQKNLGYIPQSIYLTDDTITRNIAFGILPENIDINEVKRAAKIAKIHDFITDELTDGYDSLVGERGVRLSGGQRQRIGIARSLYRDPKVLVLDEATSALDNATENAVMDAIHTLSHKKTIIMIAHRLSTLKECDVIYQMEKGRIVNHGEYSDLVTSNKSVMDLI